MIRYLSNQFQSTTKMYEFEISEDYDYVDEDSEHTFRDFDIVYYQDSNKKFVSCCSLIQTCDFLFVYLLLLTIYVFLRSS